MQYKKNNFTRIEKTYFSLNIKTSSMKMKKSLTMVVWTTILTAMLLSAASCQRPGESVNNDNVSTLAQGKAVKDSIIQKSLDAKYADTEIPVVK